MATKPEVLSGTRGSKPATDESPKRPRGRPMLGALSGMGGFKRTNLSLDDESLAIAERIHSNRTAAVRIALAFWAEHNPPAKRRK